MFRTLILVMALAFSAGASANDALNMMRQQLQVAIDNGLDPSLIQTIQEAIAAMEADAAENATAAYDEAPAEVAAAPQVAAPVLRSSYFREIGKPELDSCSAAGDFQIDSLCSAAMLRYSDYVGANNGSTDPAAIAELWRRHELTAQSYIQAQVDFRHDANTPTLTQGPSAQQAPAADASQASASKPAEDDCAEGQHCVSKQ